MLLLRRVHLIYMHTYVATKDIARASCHELGQHHFQHTRDQCSRCVCGYFHHWESDNSSTNKWGGQILLLLIHMPIVCHTFNWIPLNLIALVLRQGATLCYIKHTYQVGKDFKWHWLCVCSLFFLLSALTASLSSPFSLSNILICK